MGDMTRYSDGANKNDDKLLVPKQEIVEFDFPDERVHPNHVGDNVASSSGSNIRSSLIGMGFSPALVDKVIEEKGEEDFDLLLESLFEHSDNQKAGPQSSDSLDSLFGDKHPSSPPEISTFIKPKQEPDVFEADEDYHDKRAALLMMDFDVNEVDFALEKLGGRAPIDEIVDFIIAARIAQNMENEIDVTSDEDEDKDEENDNETLFVIMEKTLKLLEMGFSDNEISLAIENIGSDVPISELADAIVSGGYRVKREKDRGSSRIGRDSAYDAIKVKTEDNPCAATQSSRPIIEETSRATQSSRPIIEETSRGKRLKEEFSADIPASSSQMQQINSEENRKGKRPKQEDIEDPSSLFDSLWIEEEKVDPNEATIGMPQTFRSNPSKSIDKMVAKPPYFLYGNVLNIALHSWARVSQFLYSIEPEFVDTRFFSALSRKEGYVHNLPTTNRSHVLQRSPMTVQEAIPNSKKWWPSWDTRTQLRCINAETNGVSQLCDRLGRLLVDCRGNLSPEQQRGILNQCQKLNLIWAGPYKLSPVDPQHLERILGYPLNHTQAAESSLIQRLESLQLSFQTDTLGYQLSVLKSMYPGGLTLLSVFSGIGAAEVTLHRLGIRLKGVISIEYGEANRRILKRWWISSGQTGELEQIEDIQKLTTKKLDSLIEKFGGIDLIVCQNSCAVQTAKSPAVGRAVGENLPIFDFFLFNEFVRVLQRVRSTMERKR